MERILVRTIVLALGSPGFRDCYFGEIVHGAFATLSYNRIFLTFSLVNSSNKSCFFVILTLFGIYTCSKFQERAFSKLFERLRQARHLSASGGGGGGRGYKLQH